MAPTILIFSIAMSADYSFELTSIVHWMPQFFMHNRSILGGRNVNGVQIFQYNSKEIPSPMSTKGRLVGQLMSKSCQRSLQTTPE